MPRTDDTTTRPGRSDPQTGRRGLRLVGEVVGEVVDVVETPRRPSRADDASAQSDRVRRDRNAHREWEVSAENRAAASIETVDARWVLAVRAADALEGGRAAVLKPEVRARLLASAKTMGLRPFDANLILAVVQDAARQGRPPSDAATIGRLSLVAPPERSRKRWSAPSIVLLLALSAVWAAALVWWLIG